MTAEAVKRLLEQITVWAEARPDVRAVALVGSWAREAARPNSDMDLMLLVFEPELFERETKWVKEISVSKPKRWQDEDYGAASSRRVFLEDGSELEFTFSTLAWASTAPVDPGTFRVIKDGCRILYDPEGILEQLTNHVRQTNRPPNS
ncbi:MAG: aminoglycoside 6-adenylyltransferase [Thermaceae bacterium]|nr:aminoglycoside 6-adenylyltransferase [Thermaceae bacterium]